jgi:hypothetical protein
MRRVRRFPVISPIAQEYPGSPSGACDPDVSAVWNLCDWWVGGHNSLLTVASRFGMHEQQYEIPRHSAPEGIDMGVLKAAFTGTDDLKNLAGKEKA